MLLASTLLSSFTSATCNLSYDANGSLMIDTQCNRYQYNAKEQLIGIKSPEKALQCHYTYSPEGLRNAKTCRSSDNHHMQLNFIYQNNQLINAEDTQHNSQSAYLSKDARYLANAFNQHAYYFSAAKHGTTDLLLSSSTKLKKVYNFSSYGQQRLFSKNKPLGTISFSQPLAYNPLTYDGEYQDPETGFVYLRARFYNLQQMRFMQRDSYNLLNRYNAFDDNPVSNTDPSGHSSIGDFFSTDIGAGLASSMSSMMLFGALAPFAGEGIMGISIALPALSNYLYTGLRSHQWSGKRQLDVLGITAASLPGGAILSMGPAFALAGLTDIDELQEAITKSVFLTLMSSSVESAGQSAYSGKFQWQSLLVNIAINGLSSGVYGTYIYKSAPAAQENEDIVELALLAGDDSAVDSSDSGSGDDSAHNSSDSGSIELQDIGTINASEKPQDPISQEPIQTGEKVYTHAPPQGSEARHFVAIENLPEAHRQEVLRRCPQCRAAAMDQIAILNIVDE